MKDLEFGKDPPLAKTREGAGKLTDPHVSEAQIRESLRPGKATGDLFMGNFKDGNTLPGRGRAEK